MRRNVYITCTFRRNVIKNRVDVHGGIHGKGEDVSSYGRCWCGYITQIYSFIGMDGRKLNGGKFLYNR